jgi:hypothetical protein
MTVATPEEPNSLDQSWTVDLFRPEDAAGVVALYRAIYGELFPKREVYQAEWHVEQARTHDTYRVVARAGDGTVIGTSAAFRSSPTNPELYEGGSVMLLPGYSRGNLALKLFRFIFKQDSDFFMIRQIWGECVCNHVFTQMHSFKVGSIANALEVESLPEGSFQSQSGRNLTREGRVSMLVMSRIAVPNSQNIYLPLIYREVLPKIYEPFQFGHTYLEARWESPASQKTDAFVETMAIAGVSRITVYQIGADFAGWLRQVESEARDVGVKVFQVIVPLNTPLVGLAAECLKNVGYWLSGFMPRWFGADGLMMQKTLQEPDFSKIKVYSKSGKAILAMVQADYEKQHLLGCHGND